MKDRRLHGLLPKEIKQESLQRERAIVAAQTKQKRCGESQGLACVFSEEFSDKQRLAKNTSGKSGLLGKKQSSAEVFATEIGVDEDRVRKMAECRRITVDHHQGLRPKNGRKRWVMRCCFDEAVFIRANDSERRRRKVLATR